ncbi:MAG: hypothetical protein KDJ88_04345 [Bauldia sp.]|nr:hypothetical protein [Bauldia sp.]
MTMFLIEVSLPRTEAMSRIQNAVRAIGSHFASHADWRPRGGAFVGTMFVDLPDDRAALMIVPPAMREGASIHSVAALAA